MGNEQSEILKLLIENQEEPFSIRKISQLRKINYKSAYNAVGSLRKQGIIDLEELGNVSICRFKRDFNAKVFEVESSRRDDLLRKNKDLKVIFDELSRINKPFIAVLFGSHAKGTAKKNSDIDLLLIGEDAEKIKDKLSWIPLKIHFTLLGYDDFIRMLKSKEQTVVSEIVKKNIILIGIEEYYRVLNNAG